MDLTEENTHEPIETILMIENSDIIKSEQTLELIPEEPKVQRVPEKRVILNIGGCQFEVGWKSLSRYPQTRLGKLAIATSDHEKSLFCDEYNESKNEFYFDRGAKLFESILAFYRTGCLHLQPGTCVEALQTEMLYWELDEAYIAPCCMLRYYQLKELDAKKEEIYSKENLEINAENPEIEVGKIVIFRQRLWATLQNPQASCGARLFSNFSLFVIIISLVSITIDTHPMFDECTTILFNPSLCLMYPNLRLMSQSQSIIPDNYERTISQDDLWVKNSYIRFFETFLMIWFTCELLLRFFASPMKKKIFNEFGNIVDILVLVPFYTFILLPKSPKSFPKLTQFLILMRLVRIFKLWRHSLGLRAIGPTFQRSFTELWTFLTFLCTCIISFSFLLYYAEHDDNDGSKSIPDWFWLTFVTITTIYPLTFIGKLIAGANVLCLLLIIALPLPIIYKNFREIYGNLKLREILKKNEAQKKRGSKIFKFPESIEHGNERLVTTKIE